MENSSGKRLRDPIQVLATLLAAGRRGDAVRVLGELRKISDIPDEPLLRMAQLASRIGEYSIACEAAERFAARLGRQPARALQAGAILAAAGRFDRATAIVAAEHVNAPDDPSLNHFLGTVQQQLGNTAAANELLMTALAGFELSGITWLTLAAQHRFGSKDPLLDRMERLRANFAEVHPNQKVPFEYALGKAYVDIGATDRAFDEFVAAGKYVAESHQYDAKSERAEIDELIVRTAGQSDEQAGADVRETSSSIFVIGTPRSGTTLLQRLLSTRPAVSDGGEFPGMLSATMDLRRQGLDDAARLKMAGASGRDALHDVARIYRHLVKERFRTDRLVVDKSVTNTRFAGLIARVFPTSPMILIERDPADVAWSCLRTHFSAGQAWSWTVANVAAHLEAEYRLLRHWKNVLGNRLICIRYEDLVRDPLAVLPELCAGCGLPYDESILDFYRQPVRGVTTASVVQVASPLGAQSVGVSEPVRHRLSEAIVDMSDRYRDEPSV